jgi:hypothetical protein
MLKLSQLFKKFILVALVVTLGLAALPVASSAAELQAAPQPPGTSTRLERAWARAQTVYQHQTNLLAKSVGFVTRVQARIDKASQKGKDTAAVQAALNAFAAVIPAAQVAHDQGNAILLNHAGFDAAGKVTDRPTAITTLKALVKVIKDTRTALNGTGRELREAVKAFREANKPVKP